jgi:hypothetical protein
MQLQERFVRTDVTWSNRVSSLPPWDSPAAKWTATNQVVAPVTLLRSKAMAIRPRSSCSYVWTQENLSGFHAMAHCIGQPEALPFWPRK